MNLTQYAEKYGISLEEVTEFLIANRSALPKPLLQRLQHVFAQEPAIESSFPNLSAQGLQPAHPIHPQTGWPAYPSVPAHTAPFSPSTELSLLSEAHENLTRARELRTLVFGEPGTPFRARFHEDDDDPAAMPRFEQIKQAFTALSACDKLVASAAKHYAGIYDAEAVRRIKAAVIETLEELSADWRGWFVKRLEERMASVPR